MKKNKFLYILLLSVLFVACDKEDNLTPSNLGKDWFTIENSDRGRFGKGEECHRDDDRTECI